MEKWLTPTAIVAVLALVLGAINAYYLRRRDRDNDRKEDFKRLEEKVDKGNNEADDMQSDLKVLKKQMELFWMTIEKQVAKKFRDEE